MTAMTMLTMTRRISKWAKLKKEPRSKIILFFKKHIAYLLRIYLISRLDDQLWGSDEEKDEEEQEDQEMNEEDDGKGNKDEKDQHNDPANQNEEKTQGDEQSEGLDAADSKYSFSTFRNIINDTI